MTDANVPFHKYQNTLSLVKSGVVCVSGSREQKRIPGYKQTGTNVHTPVEALMSTYFGKKWLI